MANTWTDYGINRMLDITFRGATAPTGCTVRLLSSLPTNEVDVEAFSALSEVATGNGYTQGGETVALSSSGFDVLSDDASNNRQFLQLADVEWTASGGSISAVGAALVMADPLGAYVWAIFDFGGTVTAAADGTLTMQNCELRVGV